MSYVGYVIEEIMHGRQAEVEKYAAGYEQRHAARAGRRSSVRTRAAAVKVKTRATTAPSSAQAGC